VKGVRAVAEEIEVRLPYDTKRGDESIAGVAVERLAWDSSVPPDAIEIRVEKAAKSIGTSRRKPPRGPSEL
jgi:hypothetical protein